MRPADYRYGESHEWIKLEGDIATLGITDFAAEQLGDLTYLELPAVGDAFDKGETFGVIESVKTASDLICPISGEVVEVNEEATSKFALISENPFTDGWFVRLRVSDAGEFESLMTAEAYEGMLASEEH